MKELKAEQTPICLRTLDMTKIEHVSGGSGSATAVSAFWPKTGRLSI
jgi:hypothetical protein